MSCCQLLCALSWQATLLRLERLPPPALSVNEDVEDHGTIFIYSRETGPYVTLADGTVVYLDTSSTPTPMISGRSRAEGAQGQEMPTMPDTDMSMMCQPCEQPDGLLSNGGIIQAAMPAMAMNPSNCSSCASWSDRIRRLQYERSSRLTSRDSAPKQRGQCLERQIHGTTPNLVLKEDEPTIGREHRSAARSEGANQQNHRETDAMDCCLCPMHFPRDI